MDCGNPSHEDLKHIFIKGANKYSTHIKITCGIICLKDYRKEATHQLKYVRF